MYYIKLNVIIVRNSYFCIVEQSTKLNTLDRVVLLLVYFYTWNWFQFDCKTLNCVKFHSSWICWRVLQHVYYCLHCNCKKNLCLSCVIMYLSLIKTFLFFLTVSFTPSWARSWLFRMSREFFNQDNFFRFTLPPSR